MTATLKRHALWLLVSIVGAFAFATIALGRGETIDRKSTRLNSSH